MSSLLFGGVSTVYWEIRRSIYLPRNVLIPLDPPATGHGIEDPPTGGWIPLYDETLTPEQRPQVFAQWLAQYFPHPELKKKDCYKLIYKVDTPVKTPSFTGMPFSEILTKVDFTAGPAADNHIADRHFQPALRALRAKAFFDPATRAGWNDVPFVVLYGEETTYNIVWAAWQLEAEAEKTALPIRFKSIPGANHFVGHLPLVCSVGSHDILTRCHRRCMTFRSFLSRRFRRVSRRRFVFLTYLQMHSMNWSRS